jgi:hypothetical protein
MSLCVSEASSSGQSISSSSGQGSSETETQMEISKVPSFERNTHAFREDCSIDAVLSAMVQGYAFAGRRPLKCSAEYETIIVAKAGSRMARLSCFG